MISKFITYGRQSGPGWIQAAVTLGGGSLVSSLYLGVIGGYEFLWLQPLAMLCGIVMLAAISHVTLSKEDYSDRPFRLIKKSISPALAWGWLIATVVANVVFCSSQFALATDTIQTNLGMNMPSFGVTSLLFVVVVGITWLTRIKESWSHMINKVLKFMVAFIVLSFFIVTVLLIGRSEIMWGELLMGFIPDFTMLFRPVDSFQTFLSQCGPDEAYWTDYIVSHQRDILIGAFGTAVGINMTFLLPYTLLAKGWGRAQRELSRFDLLFGLLVPFVLASTCLIIVSASQFHADPEGVVNLAAYESILDQKLNADSGSTAVVDIEQLRSQASQHDKVMSTLLAKRNTFDLSSTLEPLLGSWAIKIFGFGVLAMAISTMLVHMMMNGYAISEALGNPKNKKYYIIGALIPAILGLCSPVLWTGSIKTALVIPASVIATIFLPIAYLTFILLMNKKSVMGRDIPRNRLLVNVLMIISTGIAMFASIWAILGKISDGGSFERLLGGIGLILFVIMLFIGVKSSLSAKHEQ